MSSPALCNRPVSCLESLKSDCTLTYYGVCTVRDTSNIGRKTLNPLSSEHVFVVLELELVCINSGMDDVM